MDFMNILRKMPSFDIIEFEIEDIVRSGLVREYIVAKNGSRYVMFNHVDIDLPNLRGKL